MTDDPSIIEHDRLNAAFSTKSVLTAERKELERLLLAAAECKPLAEENTKRNGRRADILRHLLQVKMSEEFQKKTYRMSIAAFIVSLLAVGIAAYREWGHPASGAASQTTVAPVQTPPTTPAKK